MQDKLLIKYIKKKNPKGMDMLIDNYGGIIASVVRKHLGILINYEEECINDVLLSIWESIDGYDRDKNTFKNWICAIAKYKSINYRKKYLAKYEQTEINNEIYYIDKNLVKLEINEDVEDILRCLNNKDKELFTLIEEEKYVLFKVRCDLNKEINPLLFSSYILNGD